MINRIFNNLKKTFLSIDFLVLLILVIFLVVITLPANYYPNDRTSLVLTTIDEDAFQRVLFTIHNGFLHFDPNKITISAFLSYGWTYFFLNAILTFPFYLLKMEGIIVILPRIISVICAAASVFMIYKIASFKMNRFLALLVSFFLLFIPAFYENAFWMHPDHMVVLALLACFYCLIKDQGECKKYFIYSLIALGIALTIKLTALVFFIIPITYAFYGLFLEKKNRFIKFIKQLLLAGIIPVVSVIFFNPTILIPGRLLAIIQSLKESTVDNKTNHGYAVSNINLDSIYHYVLNEYYVPIIILFLLIILFCVGAFVELRAKNKRPIVFLSGLWFIFFLLYNLTQVAKLWQHYYLPVFMFAPLALITLAYFKKIKYYLLYLIIFIISVQGILQINNIYNVFYSNTITDNNRDYGGTINTNHQKEVVNHSVKILKDKSIKAESVLVSPYLPFPLKMYNLDYTSLNRVYGALSEGMLINYGYPDLIILEKDNIYFKDPEDPSIKELTSYQQIIEGQNYITKLIHGYEMQTISGKIKYEVLTNDNSVVILQKNQQD